MILQTLKAAVTAIALSLFMLSDVALSQTPADKMKDMYDSATDASGTYSNINSPGHYKSQSVGVPTMGGMSWRAPTEQTTFASVSLPSIEAGCGGIDLHLGGFSYVSGEEIEKLIGAISQNAKGFAVYLALSVIDSQVKNELSEMAEKIRELTAHSMDSCEAAKALVSSVASRIPEANKAACRELGMLSGEYNDYVKGIARCDNDQTAKEINDLDPSGADAPPKPTNINYGYEATQKYKGAVGADADLGAQQMREFMMSLTGTIIVNVDDDGTVTLSARPPIALDEKHLNAFLNGGTIQVLKCVEPDECLEVTPSTTVLSPANAFAIRVQDTLLSISDKVGGRNSAPYTTAEMAFIDQTTLPVLSALEIMNDKSPAHAEAYVASLSQLVGMELMISFVEQMLLKSRDGSMEIVGGDSASLDQFHDVVQGNLDTLHEKRKVFNERATRYFQFMEMLKAMSRETAAEVSKAAAARSGE